MPPREYVHGYSTREGVRLHDQASTLAELLHHDTVYPAGSRVLEAGCGVGAQTVILAAANSQAEFTSIDVSPASIVEAGKLIAGRGLTNVSLRVADLFDLPFADGHFDHVFVCFVLEHLAAPLEALTALKRVLRPGGSITVIEGDHGSAFFHPDSAAARKAIACLIDLQASAGGNSLIGRQLYPLVTAAGFRDVTVSPRFVYADASRPAMVEGFTRNTFTAMVEGVQDPALAVGMMDAETWHKGIADLYRTAEDDGVFCYTFFKAVGYRPEHPSRSDSSPVLSRATESR